MLKSWMLRVRNESSIKKILENILFTFYGKMFLNDKLKSRLDFKNEVFYIQEIPVHFSTYLLL